MGQIREISVKYLFEESKKQLQLYDPQELNSILFILFEDLFDISRTAVLAGKVLEWSPGSEALLTNAIHRLAHHEPVQYITGRSYFYDRVFRVNPSVLIPRPETEELVDWIVKNHSAEKPVVIDIGTGSGCIAVSLAAGIEGATVSALDISREALAVARQNALQNNVSVHFLEMDFLKKADSIQQRFDIIVSNPPYVLDSEKKDMRANVLDYEPHLALFVADNNALIYYDALLRFASRTLRPGGSLYAEINEQKGDELLRLAAQHGFRQAHIRPDMFGRERFLHVIKSTQQ